MSRNNNRNIVRIFPVRSFKEGLKSKFAAGPSCLSALKIAVVCSSNQNRSMEAHNLLKLVNQNLNDLNE